MTTYPPAQRARAHRFGIAVSNAVVAFGLCMGPIGWAAASEPIPLGEYHHTAILARDGAPPETWAMAQDRDGYLWLGGPAGLTRFDGEAFDRSLNDRLPYRQVMSLFAEANGDLWIGDRYGVITWVHEGTIKTFKGGDVPKGTVMRILRTSDGTLWAVSTRGLLKFIAGKWTVVGSSVGLTAKVIEQVTVAADRSLWVMTPDGSYRLRPGATVFSHAPREDARAAMIGLPGATWRPDGLLGDEVRDDSGAWWIPSADGVERVRWTAEMKPGAGPAVEHFTQGDGLSGAQATTALVDREGTIWVATVTGLDQFRRTKLTPIVPDKPLYAVAIALAPKSGIWIGSRTQGPQLLRGNLEARPDMGSEQVQSATTAPDGSVYMAGKTAIYVNRGGLGTKLPLPPELAQQGIYQAMTVAGDGSLWVASRGVFRFKNDKWTTLPPISGVDQALPIRMTTAANGDMWWGYRAGIVVQFVGDSSHVFSSRDGITAGNILGLLPVGDHVWIAGDGGLNVMRNGRAIVIRGRGGEAFLNVSGIVEDRAGDLWLNSLDGLFHIAREQLQRAMAPTHEQVVFEKFTQQDGLLGPTDSLRPGPSMLLADDGRLWVATSLGVSWMDLASIKRNSVPPVAAVVSINQQSAPADGSPAIELAPGTTRLDVQFTAPSLAVPSRVMFRYRLAGLEHDWQEAGARREAVYANLGPGHYTFEVVASNEDGVWSVTPSRSAVTILPTATQTWWFRALCTAFTLVILAGLYLRRLSHVTSRINARLGERERIARELHDTVLQGMQALLLQIQCAIAQVHDPAIGHNLGAAAASAEKAIVEGRDKVRYLRFERRDTGSPVDVPCPIEELLAEAAPNLPVTVTGKQRDLTAAARIELQSIVHEMAINAQRHARASQVEIRAAFHGNGLTVGVYDDGIGIDAVIAASGRAPGRWGLAGMRERARELGGKLTVAPLAEGGTAAEVYLPGRRVFVPRLSVWRHRRRH
jgi:signal transduction histidine kinase/ligand-binding sensor domain-containing protein